MPLTANTPLKNETPPRPGRRSHLDQQQLLVSRMQITHPEKSRKPPPRRELLVEPIIVAEFWANRHGNSVRIQLRAVEGRPVIDIRRYFTNKDGHLRPSKKGICVVIARLPDLASGISKALAKAQELGLLADEHGRRS